MSYPVSPPADTPEESSTPIVGTPKIIVWAFVLSLAGILIITALVAVAMVLRGWKEVRASGRGKGLSITALILSGFWLVMMVIAILLPTDEAVDSGGTKVAGLVEISTVSETTDQVAEPTVDQVGACFDAWYEENQAALSEILDDATLRATAVKCPDYETWEFMKAEIGYANTSPNLLRALCVFETTSPVCVDAKRLGKL
jgi:hypothetical protein